MNVSTFTSFDDLPLLLSVDQVSNILGLCRKNTYYLVKKENLAIRCGEKRLLIPKDRFINYINKKDDLFAGNE